MALPIIITHQPTNQPSIIKLLTNQFNTNISPPHTPVLPFHIVFARTHTQIPTCLLVVIPLFLFFFYRIIIIIIINDKIDFPQQQQLVQLDAQQPDQPAATTAAANSRFSASCSGSV